MAAWFELEQKTVSANPQASFKNNSERVGLSPQTREIMEKLKKRKLNELRLECMKLAELKERHALNRQTISENISRVNIQHQAMKLKLESQYNMLLERLQSFFESSKEQINSIFDESQNQDLKIMSVIDDHIAHIDHILKLLQNAWKEDAVIVLKEFDVYKQTAKQAQRESEDILHLPRQNLSSMLMYQTENMLLQDVRIYRCKRRKTHEVQNKNDNLTNQSKSCMKKETLCHEHQSFSSERVQPLPNSQLDKEGEDGDELQSEHDEKMVTKITKGLNEVKGSNIELICQKTTKEMPPENLRRQPALSRKVLGKEKQSRSTEVKPSERDRSMGEEIPVKATRESKYTHKYNNESSQDEKDSPESQQLHSNDHFCRNNSLEQVQLSENSNSESENSVYKTRLGQKQNAEDSSLLNGLGAQVVLDVELSDLDGIDQQKSVSESSSTISQTSAILPRRKSNSKLKRNSLSQLEQEHGRVVCSKDLVVFPKHWREVLQQVEKENHSRSSHSRKVSEGLNEFERWMDSSEKWIQGEGDEDKKELGANPSKLERQTLPRKKQMVKAMDEIFDEGKQYIQAMRDFVAIGRNPSALQMTDLDNLQDKIYK